MNELETKLDAAIRTLVADNPGTIYKSPYKNYCYYTKGVNTPGCIIGQALIKVDPTLKPRLKLIDKTTTVGAGALVRMLGLNLSEDFKRWLSWLQFYQDHKNDWATALKKADG